MKQLTQVLLLVFFFSFFSCKKELPHKIQLKGRFTVDKKYIGKEIYIAFIENNVIKLYIHDEAVNMLSDNIINSKSWSEKGGYSWGQTPNIYNSIIREI